MIPSLVLSLFPGADLFGLAFESVGFVVVRGPDVQFGSDVRNFHPPPGRFDGVIGGPPCQMFSRMRHVNPKCGHRHGNLIPEFERVVSEAMPRWFVMENVEDAPLPSVHGYAATSILFNNRWTGAEQNRLRRFTFGMRGETPPPFHPEIAALDNIEFEHAACASGGRRAVPVKMLAGGKTKNNPLKNYGYSTSAQSFRKFLSLQGLPENFLSESPFTAEGKMRLVGNGVPLPTGRAIANAVIQAVCHRERPAPPPAAALVRANCDGAAGAKERTA